MYQYQQPMYQNYPYGGMMGYAYPNQQMPKGVQILTQDQINMLRRNVNDRIQITQEDALRARCTHKDINGVMTLVPDENEKGLVRCTICGAVFNSEPIAPGTLQEAINTVSDCLQQTKTYWLDIPADVAKDYMTIIPLLTKLPRLYNIATEHFNRASNYAYVQPVNQAFGGFNAVDSVIATGMSPYMNPYMMGYQQPYMQQPMMGGYQPQPQVAPQYQPAPQAAPAPVQQQMMNAPYQPNFNVFGYEGGMQQPAPAYNGYQQVQPQVVAQPAPMGAPAQAPVAPQTAPAAPAEQAAIPTPTAPAEIPTVNKQFTL